MYQPLVSLIIPCRNEGYHIKKCIESILAQSYPHDKVEIIFVDGKSSDDTVEIISQYKNSTNNIHILINEDIYTQIGLNKGIESSSGDLVIILSSHSSLDIDFIANNVSTIITENADCSGGIIKTVPSKNTIIAQSISYVLSHPFGVGNSYFRIGVDSVKEVDTVPFGCYKREVFNKIGLFNINLIRNQDIEYNLRLKDSGGKIVLNPSIISTYFSRGDLKGLFIQNFNNGFWVIFSLNFAKIPFSARHLIPMIFVLTLALSFFSTLTSFSFSSFVSTSSIIDNLLNNKVTAASAIIFLLTITSYSAVNIISSLHISSKKGYKYLLTNSISFATLHISYGLGSIWGVLKSFFKGSR